MFTFFRCLLTLRSHVFEHISKLKREILDLENEKCICAGDFDNDTLNSPIGVSYHLELHVAI
jgi:hypothetical protein